MVHQGRIASKRAAAALSVPSTGRYQKQKQGEAVLWSGSTACFFRFLNDFNQKENKTK